MSVSNFICEYGSPKSFMHLCGFILAVNDCVIVLLKLLGSSAM